MTASPEERKSGVEANWQEHRREQLRRWAALPLREQLAAVEEMGELARRIREARVMGVESDRDLSGKASAMGDFSGLFRQAMGLDESGMPLPYQKCVATNETFPQLLDIPTGLGKTAAAVLAWVWRRRFADESIRSQTPRRLLYCLPMRVLVEQTFEETVKWLHRLGLLAGVAEWTELDSEHLPTTQAQLQRSANGQRGYEPDLDATEGSGWASQHGDHGTRPIAVHLLLGGEEKSDWALYSERDAVLIGTQDMLISRALNRGYAAGRARWPLEFAMLNNDCLWVFDEIQIMDTSLATSLQLDAWRRSLPLRPGREEFPKTNEQHLARPCQSLWMSATMAKHWLERAVDWAPRAEAEWEVRHQLSKAERTDGTLRSGQLFQIRKQLNKAPIDCLERPRRADKRDAADKQTEYLKGLAQHIAGTGNHAESGLTLVIVNTVDRAAELFELLRQRVALDGVPIKLVHSRFRPFEREQWSEFLKQKNGGRRILIATQVVEAGVDLSASVLYTELAPWAALVQRFGRCARYPDESGRVIWLDLDLGEKQPVDHWARPYDRAELTAARKKLEGLDDVGLESLRKIKEEIDSEPGGQQAEDLFGYDPRFVPRDKDLFDLFDTTPDLSGADVDVSRFIRDGEELDVQVFWREVSGKEPGKRLRPHRRELCPVPFHRFRCFVREELKQGRGIWRRRYATGRSRKDPWEPLHRSRVDQAVFPGQVFLLERACGGYHPELGWTGDPRHNAFDLPVPAEAETRKSTAADDEEHADDLSISEWQSVLHHTRDVCQELESILTHEELHERLTDSDLKVLRLAARWHDRGKAHLSFTAKIKAESLSHSEVQQRLEGQPPAKAPEHAWRRDPLRTQPLETPDKQRDRRRPGHRHELASALSILETLYLANPAHEAFAWPDGLSRTDFGGDSERPSPVVCPDEPFVKELNDLCRDEFDLLVYLVAAHHGKVRMSLRSSPDDDRDDVPDPVPADTRQARGVRDGDELPLCEIPAADLSAAGMVAPGVTLWLDPMELGLSPRYGASWRERMQLLLERLGPFRLAYLEALLRAADCRASMKNDERGTGEA